MLWWCSLWLAFNAGWGLYCAATGNVWSAGICAAVLPLAAWALGYWWRYTPPERPPWTGRCVICDRPLPPRRWWQWTWLVLDPLPFCRDTAACIDRRLLDLPELRDLLSNPPREDPA